MDWYEAEVQLLEQVVAEHCTEPDLVVFYGSSSIRLWDTLREDLCNSRVLNLGFGGSTLEACTFFFSRLVAPLLPCSLIVYAGDNDLGDGRSPTQVLRSFKQLWDLVKRVPAIREFGFISIKPSPARAHLLPQIRSANKMICEEIARRSAGRFIDLFPAMLDANGEPRPELFQEDGLHMNRSGYQLWTDLLSHDRDHIFTTECLPAS